MRLTKCRSFTLTVLLLALIAIADLSILNAEEVRHPSNLGKFIEESVNNYEEFLNWLKYTGLASRFNINLSDVNNIMNKSMLVLEEVYRNATLSMFISGSEFKHLKIFSRLSEAIRREDVAKLLKAIAIELNMSKISFSCRDVFNKFFTNTVKPKTCRYNETDLDHLTWYIMTFHRGLPSSELPSILSKIYTIKIILKVGAVYRDVLNNILEDLLYRESIVLYLIINDVIHSNEVAIVTPPQGMSIATLSMPKDIGKKSTERIITIEDVEKAMKLLNEIMKLSEEYGLDISSQDVINIVNYILSMDIEEALKFIESIDINYLRYISSKPSAYYIGNTENSSTITEEKPSNLPRFISNIPEGVYPYYEGEYYEEFTREFYHSSSGGGSGYRGSGYTDSGENSMNFEVALEGLAKSVAIEDVVEKLNSIPIAVSSTTQTDLIMTTTTVSIHRRTVFSTQSTSKGWLGNEVWIYLALLFVLSLGVAIIFRPHIIFNLFARFSKVFKGANNSSIYKKSDSVLELFWLLIEKLASILNIKISISDTHREAFLKLVDRIDDEYFKRKLEDVTKGYEVLRYSDKPYVDKEQWSKIVKSLLERYR